MDLREQVTAEFKKGLHFALEAARVSISESGRMVDTLMMIQEAGAPDQPVTNPLLCPMLTPKGPPRINLIRDLVRDYKAIAYQLLFLGELKQVLPSAPLPSIYVVQCTKWGEVRIIACPYVEQRGSYLFGEPRELIPDAEAKRLYLSAFVDPSLN